MVMPHRRRRPGCRSSPPPNRPASACPTSCVTQGKCKECVVEMTRGMELLTPPTEFEKHLDARAAVSVSRASAASPPTTGEVECHTMRRGQMRIERTALHLPATHATTTLDPAVVRDGDRVVDAITGEEIDRSTGPIHGLAIDLGTTTIVVRLDRSRNRRARRGHLVREPAALWRLGRHVPDPLRHRASGPPADADARRLL